MDLADSIGGVCCAKICILGPRLAGKKTILKAVSGRLLGDVKSIYVEEDEDGYLLTSLYIPGDNLILATATPGFAPECAWRKLLKNSSKVIYVVPCPLGLGLEMDFDAHAAREMFAHFLEWASLEGASCDSLPWLLALNKIDLGTSGKVDLGLLGPMAASLDTAYVSALEGTGMGSLTGWVTSR